MTRHITATAHDKYWNFGSACTCGWVGPRRSTLQNAACDTVVHERDAHIADAWATMVLPPGFKDWHQRVAEAEAAEEDEAQAA